MSKIETAIFGGGCFWCTEAIFRNLQGVLSVMPGYAGGSKPNPTYHEVSSGTTGHAEVIKIEFDPQIIPYSDLLDVFWNTHNPTTLNAQGNDTGTQYRSIILYTTDLQKQIAEESKDRIEREKVYKVPVVTQIKKLDKFYNAEDYHQQYYEKNKMEPYCQLVISPKLQHLKEKYSSKLKDSANS